MVKRDPIQGVIDGRLLTIRLRSEEDECRLYTINAWHCQAHISQNWNLEANSQM